MAVYSILITAKQETTQQQKVIENKNQGKKKKNKKNTLKLDRKEDSIILNEYVLDFRVVIKGRLTLRFVQLGLAFLDVLLFAPDYHSSSLVRRLNNDISSVLEELESSPFTREEIRLCRFFFSF